MMICHCNSIRDRDIHAAISWMRAADPANIITPGKVYRALGKKADWPNVCYGEYSTLHQSKTHMRMIRTANWKLVRDFRNPERDELFDLKNDPAESQNVIKARKNAAVVKELHGMILARMREVKDPVLKQLQPKTET